MRALLNLMLISTVAFTGGATPLEAEDPEAVRREFEEIATTIREGRDIYLGYGQCAEIRAEAMRDDLPADEKLDALHRFGQDLVRLGELDEAIALIEETFAADKIGESDGERLRQWILLRGLAYLRQAEITNCIAEHNQDCCVFPLAGGGVHDHAGPAKAARESYLSYLELEPDDQTIQWLVNVLSMAIDDYPEAVDERYRIPPKVFEEEGAIERFRNLAPDLDVDAFGLAGGAVTGDFTGNGLLDIVASDADPGGPLVFYENRGDGTFRDATEAAGLHIQLGGLDLKAVDFDGDGHLDLFVMRGAWMRSSGRMRNSLLRNNGDGTFSDVTRAAGLAEPVAPTQVAVWADFNNDGHLDVFIGNEDLSAQFPEQRFPSNLFINNGDGTFTDRAVEAGLTVDCYVKGATAGDFNNNGLIDLYVSCLYGPNKLYWNNGDTTFREAGAEAGVQEPSGSSHMQQGRIDDSVKKGASFATMTFDFNNDGWLDILVADFSATTGDVLDHLRGKPHGSTIPALYRNNGDGTFTDVAREMGVDGPYRVMGIGYGDLDNDGWLDMYLTTGTPDYLALVPNVMLRLVDGKRYEDVTFSGGFGHLQKGHGVIFADFNNNGQQDVYHQQGGFLPGDRFSNAFYVNPGTDNGYLYLELTGTESNRSAVGARIRVEVAGPSGTRSLHRVVGLTPSFGGNGLRQEIGIGDADEIAKVEVRWPSGTTATYTGLAPRKAYRIVEGAAEAQETPLQGFAYAAD